jgi:DNA-binding HxlR family transcriptional regulator
MPRRSYDHYCAISRALDVIGERWTVLVIRELLAGPRRYSDLLADLPGISTDVLATRLKELERDELVRRRRPAGTSGGTARYELTPRGETLRPVLDTLASWGAPLLEDRRTTDALRGHWFALPLASLLTAAAPASAAGAVAELRLGDVGDTRVRIALDPGAVPYLDTGAADPDAVLCTDLATVTDLVAGRMTLADALRADQLDVAGPSEFAKALRALA